MKYIYRFFLLVFVCLLFNSCLNLLELTLDIWGNSNNSKIESDGNNDSSTKYRYQVTIYYETPPDKSSGRVSTGFDTFSIIASSEFEAKDQAVRQFNWTKSDHKITRIRAFNSGKV
jgi:hypothetical protein